MGTTQSNRTLNAQAGSWRWLRSIFLFLEHPLGAALLALTGYGYVAIRRGLMTGFHTNNAYFNNLADAFLHGQLALRVLPETLTDLSVYNNQYYLYWPPFPAVVMMPFVAIFGVDASDVLVTLAIAALNVGLVAALMRLAVRREIIDIDATKRAMLVLFFTFGTVHFLMSPFGRVWSMAQIIGVTCVVLAYLAAIRLPTWSAFGLAGCAIGCAFLTRNHLIFTGLWPAFYLLWRHRQTRPQTLIAYCAVGLAPVIVAIGLFGWYNWLRFGGVTDNGLAYHTMAARFVEDYQRYGAFHPHYIPTNMYYQYVHYPIPIREGSFEGGSLFLMSPVFFAIFWAFLNRRHLVSSFVLLATCMLVAIPILLLMGTGWVQWGPRYTLDFTIPLMLLVARGTERWSPRVILLLVVLSICQNAYGVFYFMLH